MRNGGYTGVMRPLLAPPLLLAALSAFAGTVVEIAPVEVRPGGGPVGQSVVPGLGSTLSAPLLQTALTPSLLAPSAPALSLDVLKGGAAKLHPKADNAPALRQTFDAGSAASEDTGDVSGNESVPVALAPFKPVGKAAKGEVPRPQGIKISRFPLRRGEIGWKEMWRLLNPGSDANTEKYVYFKNAAVLDKEAAMHRHNVGYVFGFRPYTWEKTEQLRRAEERARVLAERGARVRSFYGLPEFTSLSPPLVELGDKLGQGGQGVAYRVAGKPGRAVKVFNGAEGRQLQEMAAILNAVADQGFPVERVTVVRLPDGRYGLEMRTFERAGGWVELAMAFRHRRMDKKVQKAVTLAEETLHAIGRETKKALGIDAADWKAGFGGEISDDHLENFAYRDDTGEIIAFDPLVKW